MRQKSIAIAGILVTFLMALGCQTSTHEGVENVNVTHEVAFEVYNDFVVTPIRVYDVETQAIVDTGAELSILPPHLSSHTEADVIGSTDLNIILYDHELPSTPVVHVPVVEWAGQIYRDVLFAAPDQNAWDSVFVGSSVIIGGNLLARNTIEFDFPQRTMRVTQNGFHEDPFLDDDYVEYSTIPIVELSVNDTTVLALIDTGAVRTSISSQSPSLKGLSLEPIADRLYMFDGVEEREPLVPIKKLRWGEVSIHDALIRSAETDYAVIIGIDILSRLSFSISYYPRPVVAVESSSTGSVAMASMNSPQFGFSLGLGDDGLFSVVTVIEPSAAYSAGIRPGDRINAIVPVGTNDFEMPITDPSAIAEHLSNSLRADFELLRNDTGTIVNVSVEKMAIFLQAPAVTP